MGTLFKINIDDKSLLANLSLFSMFQHVSVECAIVMMLERYTALSFKQREQLEQKIFWVKHRNKGFRSLPQFFEKVPDVAGNRKVPFDYKENNAKILPQPKSQKM